MAPRNQNFPPDVKYIELGYTCAKEFWSEVVLPAYERFEAEPNRANAIDASVHAWQVHDWIWHERHPGANTWGNETYRRFQRDLLADCPELAWIRDVADAGKHRGLGRPDVKVRRVVTGKSFIGSFNTAAHSTMPLNGGYAVTTPLTITLANGNIRGFVEVLSRVIDYWRYKHFT